MQRANDNGNQTVEQMRQTVQTLALRVNQLERLLDGKEVSETHPDDAAQRRTVKFSLSNGLSKSNYTDVPIRWH